MEPKRGVCGASMRIVMHNFCQFLPSYLLPCCLTAVSVIPPTLDSLLTVCLIYAPVYNKYKYPAYQSKPNRNPNSSPNSIPDPHPNPNSSPDSIPDPHPNPSPNPISSPDSIPDPHPNPSLYSSSIPFHFDACRSICLLLLLFLSLVYVFLERPAMIGMVCGGFVIFLLVELMVGFGYTAFTLRSLATFCPIAEESGPLVQTMERWSFSFLRPWGWVVAIAMLLPFLGLSSGFISLDSRIFAEIWIWNYACVCVGLPLALFLYIRSTQVTLYLACKTYHKECKETLITQTSQHSSNDLENN